MKNKASNRFNGRSISPEKASDTAPPAPVLPVDEYVAELEQCGLTHEQAAGFLTTLVPLIWHFVDLGFRGDISELLLSGDDSDALDSNVSPSMETPSKVGKESVNE